MQNMKRKLLPTVGFSWFPQKNDDSPDPLNFLVSGSSKKDG